MVTSMLNDYQEVRDSELLSLHIDGYFSGRLAPNVEKYR